MKEVLSPLSWTLLLNLGLCCYDYNYDSSMPAEAFLKHLQPARIDQWEFVIVRELSQEDCDTYLSLIREDTRKRIDSHDLWGSLK